MNQAAQWLKAKRGKLSYRELGELVSLHHMTLANAEEGNATTDTWIVLAEHFNESVLNVLYWAGKLRRPPTKAELALEFQTRIAVNVVDNFSPDKHEYILRRLELEAKLENEEENKKATNRTRTRNAE